MRQPPFVNHLDDVLEEHLEELDFLCQQREEILFAPDWTLEELAAHEERIEAQLDGLLIGGGPGLELATAALGGDELPTTIAGALVLASASDDASHERVLEALAAEGETRQEGARLALRHLPLAPFEAEVRALAEGGTPLARAAAVDLLAFHRRPAPSGFGELLRVPESTAHAFVISAAARFGEAWNRNLLEAFLARPERGLQIAALECSARLSLPGLLEICDALPASHPGYEAARALSGVFVAVGEYLSAEGLEVGDLLGKLDEMPLAWRRQVYLCHAYYRPEATPDLELEARAAQQHAPAGRT